MNKMQLNSIHKIWTILALLGLGLVVGCNKDDGDDPNPAPIASFQFEISATNFLEVSFQNFSQNATAYDWNFGDGNTSKEQNPTHTYAAAGDYTVVLVASNADGQTAQRSQTISITDPDQTLTLLAGSSSKTWYLQREGVALGIGPAVNDNQWWSFGGVTPLGDRPCILDDSYTFTRDGNFEFSSNGTLFVDSDGNGGWLGGDEGCRDETEPGVLRGPNGEDLSALADGGDYTYELDGANNTLTINGLGAYIGLPNKTNDGDNYVPVSVKTYTIFNMAEGTIADTLQLALEGNGFSWNFYLVSYKNPADLPDIPSTQPRAGFDFIKDGNTVTFNNTSANATSYMWDFGDGNVSTEKDPVHTYTSDGDYEVTLTASDNNGNSSSVSKNIVISSASFSAAVLSNANGKVWTLAGEGSFKVGPSPASGEWWGGLDAQGVIDRACMMDDEWIFSDNGTMVYDAKGQVYAEAYMSGPDGCIDESALTPPYDALGSGTHAFEVTEANGNDRAKIKAIGTGAFIGFNKAFNGGELNAANGVGPKDEITYEVLDYAKSGNTETITLIIDISGDLSGTAYWTITLESTN